jgi:deazaflavin-dependent oxidoreductase (nitroreductase family)
MMPMTQRKEGRRTMIRQFNRAILNPLMLRIAGRRGSTYPAVVCHVGRRSGRRYRTPVVALPVPDGFIIPLPYGSDTDWCRNVRAAGRFTIERGGQAYEVDSPTLIAAEKALPLVPDRYQRVWRRFRIRQFLGTRLVAEKPQAPVRILTLHDVAGTGVNEVRKEPIMDQEGAKRRSERVTGVSNVAYDLMVVLTNKLEGVAAMEEYMLDADLANDAAVHAAFERIEQRERQDIDELRGLLVDHLQRIQVR